MAECLVVVALAPIVYLVYALACIGLWGRRGTCGGAEKPPVTLLKPICGMDFGLYDNLKSFCKQRHGSYQVVFGVNRQEDPAIRVVRRLIEEFPHVDIELVIDEKAIGINPKINNLANMYKFAKHDILIITDSDIRVGTDYVSSIASCFSDERVGAATCLYLGRSHSGLASRLGAMFINEWLMPSILVARSIRPIRFCFGASMSVRRAVLERFGGFEALASHLADDYMLGHFVHETGYRVALLAYTVETYVQEAGIPALLRHELRWARTIRAMQPLGHAFSFVMYAVPISAIPLLAPRQLGVGLATLTFALLTRTLIHYAVRIRLGVKEPAAPWLLPLRDALAFLVWVASFLGRTVEWRGATYTVQPGGRMERVRDRPR
jgi:ceramide glucosyltransferase